jgi:hypothetical protein
MGEGGDWGVHPAICTTMRCPRLSSSAPGAATRSGLWQRLSLLQVEPLNLFGKVPPLRCNIRKR